MENYNQEQSGHSTSDLIQIDVRMWLAKLLSYWWLFLLGLAIAIPGGHIYLRYTTFEYSARAILMIKEAGRSGGISEQQILGTSEGLISSGKSMDNEIQILKSLTLMEKVVDSLQLYTSYYRKGNIKETELYLDSPIFLDSFTLTGNPLFGLNLYLDVKDYNSYLLRFNENEEEESFKCYYGQTFSCERGSFKITLNPMRAIVAGKYRIQISPVEMAANRYRSKLAVERIGNQSASSVLDLKIVDPVSQKCSDILNTLIGIYNEEEIYHKNKVLRNTLKFIDQRILSLVNELDSVEGGIERFKSANSIITDQVSSSMSFTLEEIRSSVQQISEYEVQKNILASLEDFLSKDQQAFELIPANLMAESPALSGFVNQYNGLVLQRDRLRQTASDQNPMLITLEEQMIDLRRLILQTLQNLKRDLQIPIDKVQNNINLLKQRMTTVPSVEKKLLEKVRTQSIKENLFLYLLQKREETALAEVATTANTRIVDRARASAFPIYPRRNMILVFSALLGMLFPLLIVIIRSFFETRIDSEETIKQYTSIPILGRITQSKHKKNVVVKSGDRSVINEMFRLLRTNLSYLNPEKNNQTLLVTSSVPSEGKSFVALNLSIALALSNKKVVLIELDLRKPKLTKYLDLDTSNAGLTNYLIGQSTIEEITQIYKDHSNLHYISSGPIPPNPSELILTEKMEQLLTQLSQDYDYVVIDTPPIGLVSDALLLRKYVDQMLILVRHRFTHKAMLKNLEEMSQKGELTKASLVFNGIKHGKGYYGYGGYAYSYGQGYYTHEE